MVDLGQKRWIHFRLFYLYMVQNLFLIFLGVAKRPGLSTPALIAFCKAIKSSASIPNTNGLQRHCEERSNHIYYLLNYLLIGKKYKQSLYLLFHQINHSIKDLSFQLT